MTGLPAAWKIPLVAVVVPYEQALSPNWERFRKNYPDLKILADYGTCGTTAKSRSLSEVSR